MSVSLSPIGGVAAQFFDNNGNVLAGGKLYSYEAGTTTPKTTYTSYSGTIANSNPIILTSAGRIPYEVWLTTGDSYKFVLTDSVGNQIGTWDNIYGYSSGSVDAQTEVQYATADQTLFVLTGMAYTPGANTLGVYVDGVNQVVGNAYVETNATSVTFVSGLHEGATVKFINLNIGSTDASVVTYEPGPVGSVATTVQAKLRESVSVKDFGAVGDGVTDDTAAIQAALDSGAGKVLIPEGTYKVAGELLSSGCSIIGDGIDKSIITAEGDASGTYANGGVLVIKGSAPSAISALSVSPSAGARTLTFSSSHGLAEGDLILIYNPTDGSFNPVLAYYRAGEYAVVATVDSSTQITLTSPLYAGYTAANVNLYKCTGYATTHISELSVVAPGGVTNGIVNAIRLINCVNSSISNVKATNSDNATVAISQSYNFDVSDVYFSQTSDINSFGTNYGLVIGNSQNARVSGDFIGNRHAVSQGGGNDFSVPNRGIIVHDFTAQSMKDKLHTIDWHGNCEYCIYTAGHVKGSGVSTGANHNTVTDVTFVGTGYLVYGSDMLGMDFTFSNLSISTTLNDASRGVIDFGGNGTAFGANTTLGGTLKFSNITIDAPNQTSAAVLIRNRGASVSYDVMIDGLYAKLPSSSIPGIRIQTVSGSAPVRVQAVNCTCIGSSGIAAPLELAGTGDTAALVRQTGLTGKASITTNTGVDYIDSAVSFTQPFAKAPIVSVSTDISNTSADRCGSFIVSVAYNTATLELRRVDQTGVNFSGATSGYLYWQAELKEF